MGSDLKLARVAVAALYGRFKVHFSQFGEERSIYSQFPAGFSGTYLDIGGFDPFKWSNTARLWMMGWNGCNVDANRASVRKFERWRPGDLNIWGAVVPSSHWSEGAEVIYSGRLGSPDPVGKVALDPQNTPPAGQGVPALTLGMLADRIGRTVDFLNIDIEGLDEAIIQEPDLERLAPRVIAMEQPGLDIHEILARPASGRLRELGYAMIGRIKITSIFARI